MRDKEDVKEIISDSLGPILKYDQERGTELLKRLQVYLEHLGAKNETAEALHIVRQTLYHRLNRIELLLGEDFMTVEKILDRKSTRLNSSHVAISYAVFCLKKKKTR